MFFSSGLLSPVDCSGSVWYSSSFSKENLPSKTTCGALCFLAPLLDTVSSVCEILYLAEDIFRKRQDLFLKKNATEQLTYNVMRDIPENLFPYLEHTKHLASTSDGADNHMHAIVKLILKKYFVLRLKKAFKDQKKVGEGNRLHRLRIFKGD